MRLLLFLIFSCGTIVCYCQEYNIDSCGISKDASLNYHEAIYFNKYYETRRKDFDFNNKKIAFFYGSSGRKTSNKEEYFKQVKAYSDTQKNVHTWQAIGTQLILLDSKEKLITGYDAVLISWSKMRPTNKFLVKRLKR